MPHLDAGALSADPEGLEFLSKVLEIHSDSLPPRRAFDVPARKRSADRSMRQAEVNRPRRLVPISEAV